MEDCSWVIFDLYFVE